MNKILLGAGAVALLAVLTLGVTLPKNETPLASQGPKGEQGPAGPVGPRGPEGSQGPKGDIANISGLQSLLQAMQGLLADLKNQPKLGAVSGTDLPNPNCTGGLCTAVVEGICADATTTLARIDNPLAGTSTVSRVVIRVTNPATTTVRLNVATTTAGSGHAPSAKGAETATTTGLVNRVTLTSAATTTIDSLDAKNDVGFSSRFFQVGPKGTLTDGRASTTATNKVTIAVEAHGEDSLAGVTNGANNFACRYSVEFSGLAR